MKNFIVKKEDKNYWVSRSVAVVAYVYAYIDGKLCILANKRGPGLPDNVGLWNCPSGFLDYDETLEEAAAREVWEETGVKINISSLELKEIDSSPDRRGQNVLVRYKILLNNNSDNGQEYLNMVTNEHSEPNEVSAIAWMPIEAIDGYDWVSEKHKNCIKEYTDIDN